MPTKHVVKKYTIPAYYHIYNRASGERLLFRDDEDRAYFLNLIQKHLIENDDQSDEDPKRFEVEVIAYCLMGTHFHLLLYQEVDPLAISGFMRSLGTTYSMYYNRKYKSKGHVFQSSFRASHVGNESYLAHITRYIHLNPRQYHAWKWSSYREYVGERDTPWVHADRLVDIDSEKYREFMREYSSQDLRKQKSELSKYLAF